MMNSRIIQMIDVYKPEEEVEVHYRDGSLWINIDGLCRLRVKGIDPSILRFNIVPEKKE